MSLVVGPVLVSPSFKLLKQVSGLKIRVEVAKGQRTGVLSME